jgi:hypothetical protein
MGITQDPIGRYDLLGLARSIIRVSFVPIGMKPQNQSLIGGFDLRPRRRYLHAQNGVVVLSWRLLSHQKPVLQKTLLSQSKLMNL